MGKLHTIKREVIRNPTLFFKSYGDPAIRYATGAIFSESKMKWMPTFWTHNAPYAAFIRKVLLDLGYKISVNR